VACTSGNFCPSGSTSGNTACAAGSYCATPATQVACAAGSYSQAGALACTACAGNTFAAGGAVACTPCPSNTVGSSPRSAQSTCLVAQGYFISAVSDSITVTACLQHASCAGLTTSVTAGVGGNLLADPGFYYSAGGATTACPAGFTSNTGATSVAACSVKCDVSTPAGCAGDYLFDVAGTHTVGCYYGSAASGLPSVAGSSVGAGKRSVR
jgi:hypothetical protein